MHRIKCAKGFFFALLLVCFIIIVIIIIVIYFDSLWVWITVTGTFIWLLMLFNKFMEFCVDLKIHSSIQKYLWLKYEYPRQDSWISINRNMDHYLIAYHGFSQLIWECPWFDWCINIHNSVNQNFDLCNLFLDLPISGSYIWIIFRDLLRKSCYSFWS